ncbi:MAG: nitrite reductase/ring-hydroxylating ferredoxin subunit/DMSO [Polyangiales bacterium]|jgi:nitrite reductase/ring-hydroxylating ferredoxin subunit/DMSO/TMAO reductase YedYZ heme-binding membrane subunit
MVQWTRTKIVYDVVLLACVAAYYFVFLRIAGSVQGGRLDARILEMRAWGTCAFVMLTMILCIGPLARLRRSFLPAAYNRRHFGVLFFLVALLHARAVLGYYYSYTGTGAPSLAVLLTADNTFTGASMPFPLFGAAALFYFLLMAVTSHDFWQKTLGASWKTLHMGIYGAYALVVLHVGFGALRSEAHPVFVALVIGSVALVGALHLLAARAGRSLDSEAKWVEIEGERWVDAGAPSSIRDGYAIAVAVPGQEIIAVVRDGNTISALHGVCAHQGGPLYEGRVQNGALVCPWHGWTYRPADGCSPPPFTEKIPTHAVRLHEGRVLVCPKALPPGTATTPVTFDVAEGDLVARNLVRRDEGANDAKG